MSNDRFKIPRTSDEAVIAVFRELGRQFGFLKATVSAVANVTVSVDLIADDPNEELGRILDHQAYLIQVVQSQLGHMSVSYHRGGHVSPEQRSSVSDEIVINFNDGNAEPSVQQRLAITACLSERLNRLEIGRLTPADLSPDIQQILAIHQSNLVRLEELNEKLIERSSDFREDLERKFQARIEENQRSFEDQRRLGAEALAEQQARIEEREHGVASRLAEIDDRNNTHARREIRDRMLTDVKARIESFGVSPETSRKRNPVAYGMFLMIAAIGTLIFLTFSELKDREITIPQSVLHTLSNSGSASAPQAAASATKPSLNPLAAIDLAGAIAQMRNDRSSELYWLWARLGLLSLSLLGTILFYIKWQNKWADQHATSEFQLQQFYIDVNRANWVIESCLEWRKETDSPIPRELLSSITNGLFVNPTNEPERVIHPADELASALMGSASKLKMKLGDSDLEFEKPGKTIPSSKPV